MDVLQVAPYFPPYQGGQENHVESLTRHLRERGDEVKVLTSDYPPDETAEDRTGDVYRLPVLARILRNPIVSPRAEILRLFRWADVAHTHNEHATVSNIAALVGAYVGTPTVLTCHGQLSFGNPVSDGIESLYNRTVGAATLKAMDRVIALSESDREYLLSLGVAPGDVEIVPNAIEPPDPPPAHTVQAFRERHGLGDRPVVLFVGPIVRRKSPETLLRAMSHVLEDHPDAMALFVGSGPDGDAARAKAESLGVDDEVSFTGYLPEEELVAAYRSASVLAVPSVSEGLPTAVMEGMIHELPVVATDLGPLRDWFDGRALLVDPEPDAFAAAISRVLADDFLADRLGSAGAELVRRRLTWDRVSTEIRHVYADILGETEPERPSREPETVPVGR